LFIKNISEEGYLRENIVIPTIQVGYAKNKLFIKSFTKSHKQY